MTTSVAFVVAAPSTAIGTASSRKSRQSPPSSNGRERATNVMYVGHNVGVSGHSRP
jgi:hypothetical protein